jgi:hypothetical protein
LAISSSIVPSTPSTTHPATVASEARACGDGKTWSRYLDPDDVMTPGIFVDQIVRAIDRPKDIEQRTVRLAHVVARPMTGEVA